MKVLVPVKRVIDYNVKVRVKADGSGVMINLVVFLSGMFRSVSRKLQRWVFGESLTGL